MPTFDYRCQKCHKVHERFFTLAQGPTQQYCDACGGKMDRLPSAPAFTVTGFNAANGYSGKQG